MRNPSLLHFTRQCLFYLLCLFFPLQLWSAVSFPISIKKNSGIKIETTGLWDQIPHQGTYPIRIRIENNTTSDKQWSFQASSYFNGYGSIQKSSYQTVAQFAVPSGERKTFEVQVNIIGNTDGNGYRQISGTLKGPGINPSTFNHNSYNRYGHRNQKSANIGLSDSLYLNFAQKLRNRYENVKSISISELTPSHMSEDWRAYTGFDILLFTSPEWLSLRAPVREAILDAVALGTQLRIASPQGHNSKQLQNLTLPGQAIGADRLWGSGFITLFTQSPENAVTKIPGNNRRNFFNLNYRRRAPQLATPQLTNEEATPLKLRKQIDERTINLPLVIFSLIAFGVLVGPINLWVFARGANRYKLYFTTPLIAVSYSALMAVVIVLSDGFGGKGSVARVVITDLNAKKELIFQDQICQTNILLKTDFKFEQPVQLTPKGDSAVDANLIQVSGSYSASNTEYWGNWYSSRRIQENTLATIRPSRAGIQKVDTESDGAPVFLSQIQGECTTLFYLDDKNRYWKCTQLNPGQRTTLQHCTEKEFAKWWALQKTALGERATTALSQRGISPNNYFAEVSRWQEDNLLSLSSIDWSIHKQIFTGTVTQTEGTATHE